MPVTRYQNKVFRKEVVKLDGHSFKNCEFRECLIVIKRGETELTGCHFKDCKLLLQENALTIGRIITLFTGKSPLKVVDFDEQELFSFPADQEN